MIPSWPFCIKIKPRNSYPFFLSVAAYLRLVGQFCAAGMNVGSRMVAGTVAALGSSILAEVSYPDLHPVVFLGTFKPTIRRSLGMSEHRLVPT